MEVRLTGILLLACRPEQPGSHPTHLVQRMNTYEGALGGPTCDSAATLLTLELREAATSQAMVFGFESRPLYSFKEVPHVH